MNTTQTRKKKRVSKTKARTAYLDTKSILLHSVISGRKVLITLKSKGPHSFDQKVRFFKRRNGLWIRYYVIE